MDNFNQSRFSLHDFSRALLGIGYIFPRLATVKSPALAAGELFLPRIDTGCTLPSSSNPLKLILF